MLRANRRHFFQAADCQRGRGKGRVSEIIELAKEKRLTIERVERLALEELAENPQGVAWMPVSTPRDLNAISRIAKKKGEALFI